MAGWQIEIGDKLFITMKTNFIIFAFLNFVRLGLYMLVSQIWAVFKF